MEGLLNLYLVSGLVLALLAIPLWNEQIKPNILYGFRLPATLKDPQVWYATNRYGARWLVITALFFMAGAVGLYFVPGMTVDMYANLNLIVFLVVLTVGMIKTIAFMRRCAAERAK